VVFPFWGNPNYSHSALKENYDGAVSYLQQCGLTKEDVDLLKKRFVE
jgi:hypothetical protein